MLPERRWRMKARCLCSCTSVQLDGTGTTSCSRKELSDPAMLVFPSSKAVWTCRQTPTFRMSILPSSGPGSVSPERWYLPACPRRVVTRKTDTSSAPRGPQISWTWFWNRGGSGESTSEVWLEIPAFNPCPIALLRQQTHQLTPIAIRTKLQTCDNKIPPAVSNSFRQGLASISQRTSHKAHQSWNCVPGVFFTLRSQRAFYCRHYSSITQSASHDS